MFKSINYYISSLIPQKVYWYLAGLIHPWQAVLEDTKSPDVVYKRSKEIVILLQKFKLINKNSEILDIGCGVGRAEYLLAKKVKSVLGIDISKSMVSNARKNIKDKNVEFLVTNGKNLSEINNKKFDLIFSILVLQHVPRKIFETYLKESYLLLKKGGKLFFQISINQTNHNSEPTKDHPWALRHDRIENLKELLSKLGYKNSQIFGPSGNRITKKDEQALILINTD